ncbi:hypothetical protein ACFLU1_03575 [Chloroflexota bacterium]
MFTSKGKLYNNEQHYMGNVSYRLIDGSAANIWGELVPAEDRNLSAGSGYVMELENNRKIRCGLQTYSRHAQTIPNRRVYRFTATYPIYVN